jgi:hypothetical protein
MIHRDFLKATKCSFCIIMVGHRDSDTFTVIPNIDLIMSCLLGLKSANEVLIVISFALYVVIIWRLLTISCGIVNSTLILKLFLIFTSKIDDST